MTEDQAQAYFECFRLVWYDHKASETLQWAKSYSRCKTERERGNSGVLVGFKVVEDVLFCRSVGSAASCACSTVFAISSYSVVNENIIKIKADV